MKLKSYFSGTVEAAMELARKELGEEALLVNARPATPETRSLGALEVVFALPPASAEVESETAALPGSQAGAERWRREVSELRREVERITRALETPEFSPRASAPIWSAESGRDRPEDLIRTDSSLGRPGVARRVIALVGPPGVGKTSTLMKLAARYGINGRKPAWILSTDVFRVAAAEQLRTLACILGVGSGVAETSAGLLQALEEHTGKELILIDTPGVGRAETEDARDLARVLAEHPEIDTHLVLSASMKREDLACVGDRFAMFEPRKVIWTRIDETESFGAVASETVRLNLPVSFLSAGQSIPDDLEAANREWIAALFGHPPQREAGEGEVLRLKGAAA